MCDVPCTLWVRVLQETRRAQTLMLVSWGRCQHTSRFVMQHMLAASQSPVKVKVGMTRVIRDLNFNMGI